MDEHKHSPARRRYSKFVHYFQNYYRHRTDVIVCWLLKFHGFNLAPLFRYTKGQGKCCLCVRFRCSSGLPGIAAGSSDRYGFREDVLDSVHVPILLYCCTRIQYFALAIILSDSGERMRRDKILPQPPTNTLSMSYRYRGVMLCQALCGIQRQL